MALELAERRDVDFVLYEQLGLGELLKHERFREFNRKTIDLIISEARKLALQEMLPANGPGDREGCRFEAGAVKVPAAYRRIFDLYREGEWIALADDPQVGGQGLPVTVYRRFLFPPTDGDTGTSAPLPRPCSAGPVRARRSAPGDGSGMRPPAR